MTTDLFSLIYFSKASRYMQTKELMELSDYSRTWNSGHGITGMLLFIDENNSEQIQGRFMQVLEGSEKEVLALFVKIKADARHSHIKVLNEGTIPARNFSNWTMGFQNITGAEFKEHPHYFELDDTFLNLRPNGRFNFALNFLQSFYEARSH